MESLPSKKKDPRKKEGEQGLKKRKKRWKLSWKAPYFEKRKEKEDEIYKLFGEILLKERKAIIFFYSAEVTFSTSLIHTHIAFIFTLPSILWLFPFLPPFTIPFSINHDYLPHKLSRIFLCFYNIQGVA
jgi:hypothetical protein